MQKVKLWLREAKVNFWKICERLYLGSLEKQTEAKREKEREREIGRERERFILSSCLTWLWGLASSDFAGPGNSGRISLW